MTDSEKAEKVTKAFQDMRNRIESFSVVISHDWTCTDCNPDLDE